MINEGIVSHLPLYIYRNACLSTTLCENHPHPGSGTKPWRYSCIGNLLGSPSTGRAYPVPLHNEQGRDDEGVRTIDASPLLGQYRVGDDVRLHRRASATPRTLWSRRPRALETSDGPPCVLCHRNIKKHSCLQTDSPACCVGQMHEHNDGGASGIRYAVQPFTY
jgi:hypothetical protein